MAEQDKQTGQKERKIFVLDTSVILYDHNAVKSFQEHDVVIPIQVLEELDNFKKGNDTRNFEAREFIRLIDNLSKKHLISDWIPLNGSNKGNFKVAMEENGSTGHPDAVEVFGDNKFDHKILNVALALGKQDSSRKVILVSKDICLRLKAKALNLHAEDYETGKIRDVQKLYTGKTIVENVDPSQLQELFETGSLDPSKLQLPTLSDNHFFVIKSGKKSILCFYDPLLKQIRKIDSQTAFNITPRNAEQTFAVHALMNPNIKLITMQGVAGTGKTLLSIASALEQRRNYRQIYVTTPIIPLSNRDIGYLPGDIKSKLDPYMQPLWDNLKFIKSQFSHNDKNHKLIDEMLASEKIALTPLAYIRGRSLAKVFFIVDEAQNLTPHEVKTIISRAGDDTKIIFLGDIYQIDTPYLDAQSNGLSYLIDRIKSNPMFAHITLEKGERSQLANLANEYL